MWRLYILAEDSTHSNSTAFVSKMDDFENFGRAKKGACVVANFIFWKTSSTLIPMWKLSFFNRSIKGEAFYV